jgi:hypothetical protein
MPDPVPPPEPPPGDGAPPPYGQGTPPQPPPPYGDPPTSPYRQTPPPYGDQYGQPPQPGNQYGQPPQPAGQYVQPPQGGYPQQELLPQDVQPGRSRTPLVVALIVVLALVGGGIAAWLLLRDNGESTRAEYCAAIKKVAPTGDLTSAVAGDQNSISDQAKHLADLAPSSVSGDWKTLEDFVASVEKSRDNLDVTSALSALGALKHIVQDSNDNCGTTFTSPLSP